MFAGYRPENVPTARYYHEKQMLSLEITLFAVVLAGTMIVAIGFPILESLSGPEQDDKRAAPGGTPQQNRALELLGSEKLRVLRAIRDLDFDYDMGKLVDETYVSQRVYLIRVYVAITKKIDELQAEVYAQQARIEAAVAAFRQARQRS
jgi:hypothetical protein